ncbi:DUF998 domain-containing protein [Sulfolobus tengchongensis]|uniref:DUF998 domain-containing protein n=1 Tax=Sulfolobus tengchongensis TaxID=207809 RepID=A0AAX4KXN3_9CREN
MILNRPKIAGYIVLIGVSQFLLFMVISEILYPNYSVKYNYISDLGVGRTAIIFNTSIIVMGILVIIASLMIRAFYAPLILLVGLGASLVGIFPETTGLPHLIASLIAFLFGGIGAIVTSIRRNYFWTVLGIITLSALILFISKEYGPLGPGGMERMIVYPELIWGISFSTYLINKV